MQSKTLSVVDNIFIQVFSGDVDTFLKNHDSVDKPNERFFKSPLIKLNPFGHRSIENTIKVLKANFETRMRLVDDICSICQQPLLQLEIKPFYPRNGSYFCHLFHAECLSEWIAKKNTCPYCRSLK